MQLLIRWLILSALVLVIAYCVPGIQVKGLGAALFFSAILAGLNLVLRPMLMLLTLPFTVLTFGFFLLVVNAVVFWLASKLSFGVNLLLI